MLASSIYNIGAIRKILVCNFTFKYRGSTAAVLVLLWNSYHPIYYKNFLYCSETTAILIPKKLIVNCFSQSVKIFMLLTHSPLCLKKNCPCDFQTIPQILVVKFYFFAWTSVAEKTLWNFTKKFSRSKTLDKYNTWF